MEILDALEKIGRLIELHHIDRSRFSKTGTTYSEQVITMCSDCHTPLHADDASASRLKRK
ncbi:MAG: hypothetical protein N3A54_02930 [Patescibacteria group bacterium]|nr:hypothetical protein [Patescibacteria group bacterium]